MTQESKLSISTGQFRGLPLIRRSGVYKGTYRYTGLSKLRLYFLVSCLLSRPVGGTGQGSIPPSPIIRKFNRSQHGPSSSYCSRTIVILNSCSLVTALLTSTLYDYYSGVVQFHGRGNESDTSHKYHCFTALQISFSFISSLLIFSL